jgi:hypothetical protein
MLAAVVNPSAGYRWSRDGRKYFFSFQSHCPHQAEKTQPKSGLKGQKQQWDWFFAQSHCGPLLVEITT